MRPSRIIVAAIWTILVSGAPVLAHPPDDGKPATDDVILPPPPTYKAGAVTVDEHVGARIPQDAQFRTQDGTLVTLGDVMRDSHRSGDRREPINDTGELPVILTFNYSDCPMLCNVQLNGLTAALPAVAARGPGPDPSKGDVGFRVGAQVRIVTIDLDPNESLAKLAKMRARYIDRLPEADRADARTGWTFLVAAVPGDDASIRRVADAVGFRYTYLPEQAQWAHPAALMFLSATGVVTRYVYGIEFEPAMMRESIYKAGLAEPATAVGFMNRCYHFDPDANNHSGVAVVALRLGAAGFVVLLLSLLGIVHVIKRSKRAGVIRS